MTSYGILSYIYTKGLGMGETAFNSKPESVGGLLGPDARERVIVPAFQRGYMWQKKHVEAFWDDIDKFRKDRKSKNGPEKYFFGPIVTLWKPDEETVLLLDGQQRLATATILFSVIRDIARDFSRKYDLQQAADFARDTQSQLIEKNESSFSLQMGETDHLYFQDAIQSDPPKTIKTSIRTHRNIQQAQAILKEKVTKTINALEPLRAIQELKELRQTLRSDLIMSRIPVANERDAFRIFETLNDRGLRLSAPDLLLNYLMGKAPDNDRQTVRFCWTEMVERMGKRDITRFLRHMWVSKYGDLKKEDLFTALKNHIKAKEISSLDFAKACGDECENYAQLISVEEENLGSEATPIVRAIVQELEILAAFPLLLSSYLLLQPGDFVNVARWILVFFTRHSIIANLDPAEVENVFFALARDVRSKVPNSEDALASKHCASHIKTTLVNAGPSPEAVIAYVSELNLNPDEAKYIITRLARHIQSHTKEITFHETNLEHIYPKKPKENEWGGLETQKLLEPFLWHIGNLTIYGKRLNTGSANSEFAIKKQHFEQKTEVEMTKQIAREYSEWNVDSIKRRAIKLASLVVEIWNFDNPSRV